MNQPVVIGDATLYLGDSRQVLKTLAGSSVDSIVCDPPYELGFMGKGWDSTGVANDPALWREALRVLKPGGHLLAFSGTRTYHRMTCAIEDAGFEVRDQIGWVYGSGFPKSHNGDWGGTALKPAWEPICMARKPLIGTVEANWREHGTGALNIDACRVDGKPRTTHASGNFDTAKNAIFGARTGGQLSEPEGRWPANIIHDGSAEVVALFPDSDGQQGCSSDAQRTRAACYGATSDNGKEYAPRNDAGSAARFFYCAKASSEDRNEGGKNRHPTVKPTDLMAYLCRLVTPKGGTVLDPFMGSGSTGKAAMLEGFNFIGIDMTPEYVEIARARIEFARKQGYQPDLLEAA